MIKRTLFTKVKEHLSQKEISFITGPRQAGKTTLMLALKEYLQQRGERTLFLSLDIEEDKQFFLSQVALVKRIQLELGDKKGFVFIDEIQRKENAGIFLKGIYDMDLPYKFIVSGSGSVELKEKVHESLAGRKRIFELSTLSFEEFVDFKTNYAYSEKLSELFEIDTIRIRSLLEEYLSFGGYPRVVLNTTLEEKRATINEIYQSYLEKDISSLLHIKKTESFTHLVKLLASQVGNLVNYSEISNTLGISQKTIKDYLWYLEKTFILHKLTPFFRNTRKEITKNPLFYFYDVGLRNYALGSFGTVLLEQEKGFLFENVIFLFLRQILYTLPPRIHFWRTKDNAEVDFIIDTAREPIPIEIKYKALVSPQITRSLRSFIMKYHPKRAFVVNLVLRTSIIYNKTKIDTIPFYALRGNLIEK